MERNVIVFGATGKTGNPICQALATHHIPYSVFVREPSAHKLTNPPTQIKHGDVLNALEVEQAFEEGIFTDVIISLGSKALRNASIRSEGTKHIIDAMKKHNSQASLHVISALGVGESWNQLKWHGKLLSNLLLKSVMKDHAQQEDYIKKSPFSYHILRPVGLKDGPSTGKVHVQNEGFLPSSAIQRADVAAFLVESLVERKHGVSGICEG